MKKLSLCLSTILMVCAIAGPAAALDLHDARAQGVVGEQSDGYVGVVAPAAGAQALADSVNAQRKAEYEKISAANHQPVDVVAKLAAVQVIKKLDKGEYYQAADGSWTKR